MPPEHTSSEEFSSVDDSLPLLQVQWDSRSAVFFQNLRDTLFPRREPPLELSSSPSSTFWQDVFVRQPSRLRFIFDSYAIHVLFVLIVYGLSTSPLFHRKKPATLDPFANTHIEYYPVSQYLPPVAAEPKPAKHPLVGQPALAKQDIISVPPDPDNSRQTIVTPDLRLLKKDIPLPNIVALGEKVEPIQPLSASANLNSPKLMLPTDVIAPPLEELPRTDRSLLPPQPEVIKPAADLPLAAKSRVTTSLTPSVIQPPPSPDALRRNSGDINIAKLAPEVAPPKLPTPEQRSPGAPGGTANEVAPAAPASPSVQGLAKGKPQGQMLALSVQPADIKGPVEVPQGSRKGVFAAGPDGKEAAPGTPTIKGGGVDDRGSPGKEASIHAPLEGIYVGPAPKAPVASPDPNIRSKLLNAMRSTGPAVPPSPAMSDAPSEGTRIDNQVFGSKKFYSMVLNMPNLSSTVGSWVVRYAELNPTADKVDLSAPVATKKVDPAYPAELMRDRVEGTVVLYAIIRADGNVDSIRVLDTADARLNPVAMLALSRWHFRPGTKQGVAVDIETVVQVPFKITKWTR